MIDLRLGTCVGFILFGLALLPTKGVTKDRPNIVWLSCEDISAHLGCYGDSQATTPHIDRLATEGVRYTHAFVCAGVCAPCRSTIITGMYQTSIGTHHMRCKAQLPERIKPFTTYLRDAGYYCSNNAKEDYQFVTPKDAWDESGRRAHWRNRPQSDQPFFSVFNFTECHESGIANDAKYKKVTAGIDKHAPESLNTLPPYYPDTPAVRADWARYYDVITAMDRRIGEVVAQLKEDNLYDDTIIVFWSDHGVGLPRGKRWLYDSGMHVPLIVRIPKVWQHLAPGKAGETTNRLVSLMDLGPSMLNLAGLPTPDYIQGEPFLGPHLPPERQYVFGARDRMDERYDIIRAVRDHRFKYIRNYEPFKTYYQYMNTPEKGRLMREIRRVASLGQLPPAAAIFLQPNKPVEELYDTEKDPHEIQNLAQDPAFHDVLMRMRTAHSNWVVETKDLGLIPEPEIAARAKQLSSAFAILRQEGAETLIERVRDAAALSLMNEPPLAKLHEATQDRDAAVRYWGAMGIGNLYTQDPQAIGRMRELLDDSSNVVRVAAARALCRSNQPNDALPVLVNVLENGSQWERLHSIIVMDEIDEMARPIINEMKKALDYRDDLVARGKYTVRVANRALNELLGTNQTVP